ncbi:hypothetical protein M1N46_03355 [Dehalococcoidia bacterium]|nr:hypothetical protein [Dehalococcoidia bacterium]
MNPTSFHCFRLRSDPLFIHFSCQGSDYGDVAACVDHHFVYGYHPGSSCFIPDIGEKAVSTTPGATSYVIPAKAGIYLPQ